MNRFGAFSPLTTLASFTPGARALLLRAERASELAVHVVRLLWWLVLFGSLLGWFRIGSLGTLIGVAEFAVAWGLGAVGLRSSRAFTFTRYALVVLDAWVVVGMVLVFAGPLAPSFRDLAAQMGTERPPTADDIQRYVPPLLVYLALSGALRLDPRVAALSWLLAVAGVLLFVTMTGVDPAPSVFLVGIVVLSGWIATNAARVIRYTVLKAREEAVLEAYVPEDLTRELMTHGTVERAGRVTEVTLLLCDIRGFTKRSERLSPSETVTLVNAYLDAVCPPISGAGGVIDKFMGDGVLAFFEGGGNAARAVGAARHILDVVTRIPTADGSLRVGIALHTGEVLVGTVGPRTRREYTIISDAVNTLTRLEELNKAYGSQMVASKATIDRLGEAERTGFDGPIDVTLRGREGAVVVYALGAATSLRDDGELGSRLKRFVARETE